MSWCRFIFKASHSLLQESCGTNNFTYSALRKFHIAHKYKNERKNDVDESPLKKLLDESASFEDLNVNNPEQQWATLPYRQGTKIRKQGQFFAERNRQDPRDTSIVLFPGQGSQYVGMGKELLKFPMTRDLFELASYILKYDLLKLCLEGPKEKLDQTKYCQPAIMVCSLAAIERLKEERPNAINNCVGTAGFSLGELTALVFAGALGFERGKGSASVNQWTLQALCSRNFSFSKIFFSSFRVGENPW